MQLPESDRIRRKDKQTNQPGSRTFHAGASSEVLLAGATSRGYWCPTTSWPSIMLVNNRFSQRTPTIIQPIAVNGPLGLEPLICCATYPI